MDASDVLRNMLGMPRGEIEAFLGASTLPEIDAIAAAKHGDELREILDGRTDRIAAEEAAKKKAEEADG